MPDTFTAEHRPDGYACNMGWVVTGHDGTVLYRGPEWACRYRAGCWNDGHLTADERRELDRAGALAEQVGAIAAIVQEVRMTHA